MPDEKRNGVIEENAFSHRVFSKSITQLQQSIADRTKIIEGNPLAPDSVKSGLKLLNERLKELTRLSTKTDVGQIIGSIESRKVRLLQLKDPKSTEAYQLATEISTLQEAHKREFTLYVARKNIDQVEASIRDRQKQNLPPGNNNEIINIQLAILQKRKIALSTEKNENKSGNLDQRLEKFRSRKENNIFPEAQPKFTLEQLQSSNAKEQVGKYTLCSDRVVRKDTSHPIYAGYDTEGQRIFGKLVGKNTRNFHVPTTIRDG
jgi:hypothetical protein